MLEEGPVSGDKWAIELYGERQERGIVEGELKLFTETGSPFEQRCGGRGEVSMTIFAAISRISIIANDVGRVPVADPLPFKFPQWGERLLPGSRARILAADNGSQGLTDQFAARSTLGLSSTIHLFEEFIGKRDHHFGHYNLTSEKSIAAGLSKGNTFYIPARFRIFLSSTIVFNAKSAS
jgi:hypothetical protein